MEAMRVNWTDDRLDNLSKQVDERFKQVDHRFDRVEADVRGLRGDTDRGFSQLRGEMNGRFDRLDARFDSMQRTLFLAAAGIIAALIGTQL
jgi:hypothetical protein